MRKALIFSYFLNKKYNSIKNISDWVCSVDKYYCVDSNRTIVILTDNKDANKISREGIEFRYVDSKLTSDPGVNKLNKFNYIEECIASSGSFDYFCFLQSNARCRKQVSLNELTCNYSCDLSVCTHPLFPKCKFSELNYNKAGSVVDLSKIDTSKYLYIQNGHFIASKSVLTSICKSINGLIDIDRKNPLFSEWYPPTADYQNKNRGKWIVYDESYFNYHFNRNIFGKGAVKVNILDGNIYSRAPYSTNAEFKIEMIDKNKW